MKTRIGKWGNSLAVRIPGIYARELDLRERVDLDLTRLYGGLLLRSCKRQNTLEELLAHVNSENIHGETDWGAPIGREAW